MSQNVIDREVGHYCFGNDYSIAQLRWF